MHLLYGLRGSARGTTPTMHLHAGRHEARPLRLTGLRGSARGTTPTMHLHAGRHEAGVRSVLVSASWCLFTKGIYIQSSKDRKGDDLYSRQRDKRAKGPVW